MKDLFLLRKYIAALLLGFLGTASLLRAAEAEGEQLGQKLKKALEAYNKESGVDTFDAVKFWSARKMITESLQRKFSGHRGFEADPFLNSQEEVPGFVLKEVKIEGDQAQVTIRVKPFAPGDAPHNLIYRMRKEDGQWKIDDVAYGRFSLRKTLSEPSPFD